MIAIIILIGFLVISRRRPGEGAISLAMKAEFQSLSQETLSQASEQFLKLADERFTRQMEAGSHELQTKKELIDQQLQVMRGELSNVSQKTGDLTTQLKTFGEQATALTISAQGLREVLANSRARGQWGERMAEDILRLVGMVEGVNYRKQVSVDGGGARPDFVFALPEDLKLNMDVKFPLDNYMRYLEADQEAERTQYQSAFLQDVRARVREITGREYINPEQRTVDYVLMFIPNESIHSFIHEQDPTLMDVALRQKVICCSPLTLFAVLAVVRQATDNFALRQASAEIIGLFGRFNREWGKFTASLATLEKNIGTVQTAFERVSRTRRNALESPLRRIEALRLQRGIPIADVDVGEDSEVSPSEEAVPAQALLPAQEAEKET